ncbi:MAG: tRNA 2-thiouridine(34) synthase MnmA [Endomicrobia bacterium]|nr:tRNA 2-thiouridine(34) synthase MnmA [Endomicrobiia bacterium]MCX7940953.1 tRNA 2-thiouridine(34) synthase MnmA [Endomicrobiia bacterium]MDW8055646.1 tRNA 2-thiouridine(34) synthase MnmA [Elusimicrobiota bacterium]
MKNKVAILMSGGVDSSTAAYILVKNGYDVIGVTLKLWQCGKTDNLQRQICCSPHDIYDAKNVCSQLGIKHYVLDLSKEFEEIVIKYFCLKYKMGYTPNPCIICNEKIKFGIAFEKLKELTGIEFLATGHYARVVKTRQKFYIAKAKDEYKDQSYFLCTVPNNVLPHIMFPLGNLTKKDVREIAASAGLKVAHKKESFDICFIADRDYKNFLRTKGIEVFRKGKILNIHTNKFLGYHNGYMCYTIGQREGLGLKNLTTRMYVVKTDPETNIVYVGEEKDLYSSELLITNPIFYESKYNLLKKRKVYVKIRYKTPPVKCNLSLSDGNLIKVMFETPQRAVTRGQYAAIYDLVGRILLSGEICG